MAQSSEYPDLKWVAPRAWGSGRDGKAVRFIVIHYTAGAERSTSAEDGAAYDARRTDGTSTHYFVDRDSIIQCVRTSDRANAARHRGNRLGIQYELCGTQQTRAQWLDAASLPTLRNAARQVARDCKKYGIPVRRLSVAETRRAWTEFPNGPRGIVGHVDCTRAFPEDGGDHTDPGPEFPWTDFLAMVREEIAKGAITSEIKETEVALADELIEISTSSAPLFPTAKVGDKKPASQWLALSAIYAQRGATTAAALVAAIDALTTKDTVDEQALGAALAEGLAPALTAAVVAALPEDRDDITADELKAAILAAVREFVVPAAPAA